MESKSIVTLDEVHESIVKEEITKLGTKMTACTLTLSGTVDANNFDLNIGAKYAREKAIDMVWGHLGSIIQYKQYHGYADLHVPATIKREE